VSRGPCILVVDDDPDIASALARGLALNGFRTVATDRLADAAQAFADPDVAAAVVDVMVGEENGLNLVRDSRASGNRKPILMLSALTSIEDRADGLRAGADDYVVKPFSLDELVARLRVQLARAADRPVLSLDRESRVARTGVTRVDLTERECALLALLLDNKGRTLARGEIFDRLWTGEGQTAENVVDVYIGYLRRKLSPADAFGAEIVTVRSRGFMLRDAGDA
jgi:two-component system, OmpR family, response regulator PrrA